MCARTYFGVSVRSSRGVPRAGPRDLPLREKGTSRTGQLLDPPVDQSRWRSRRVPYGTLVD
ncbi:predicted protein [Micromonas commoda]|uniref:Uncharacterized protein n=1 Tax=Micromonas commoda (strain RCC299 / NOUM17 / CCMP2709) TaxID=296587 RepID=C1E965_MICCC|nr:predicted protein [Micromonas commoda]ACO64629.1 predicted protein [Micromonas commoda]|eukprot:XP_002503371.1 predicted protein [Micromonas commoda]